MKAQKSLLTQSDAVADTRAAFAGWVATVATRGVSGAIGGVRLALRSSRHIPAHVFNIESREMILRHGIRTPGQIAHGLRWGAGRDSTGYVGQWDTPP